MSIEILSPRTPEQWAGARHLVEEYAASLAIDLSEQDLGAEMDRMETEYGPPAGAFLLATDGGAVVGCVGVRRLDDATCEMKRLYTVPETRRGGVGRLLAEGILGEARRLGYGRMVLDTLDTMAPALALYRSLGFTKAEPYGHHPYAGTVCLGRDLEP